MIINKSRLHISVKKVLIEYKKASQTLIRRNFYWNWAVAMFLKGNKNRKSRFYISFYAWIEKPPRNRKKYWKKISVKYVYIYDHLKNLICQRNQNLMYLLFAETMPIYEYINFTNHWIYTTITKSVIFMFYRNSLK